MGRAAVCAGGRRPAREIATRELRSEWSISRPALALPPPSGTAARPCRPRDGLRSGVRVCLLWPCRRPPAPRPGPAGPAAASNRAGLGALALALPPPTGTAAWPRRPRGLAPQAPRRPSGGAWCACACPGPAAAFRVGVCGECGRIRIGCRYPDRLCASG